MILIAKINQYNRNFLNFASIYSKSSSKINYYVKITKFNFLKVRY